MKNICAIGMGALVIALGSAASAGVILVPEVGDLRASATDIDSFFDTALEHDIFESTVTPHASVVSDIRDPVDVDWYRFTGSSGSRVFLDIDEDPFAVDALVSIFDADGTLFGFNDDSLPPDAGSANGLDAFLGVLTLPATGPYFIAVSTFGYYPAAFTTCTDSINLERPDGALDGRALGGCEVGNDAFMGTGIISASGPYTLHVSRGVVPSPASLALLPLGLASIAASRSRKSGG